MAGTRFCRESQYTAEQACDGIIYSAIHDA